MGGRDGHRQLFFGIPHDELIQAIEERICDQSLLKLLRAILRAGVMEDGQVHPGRGCFSRHVQRLPAPTRSGMGRSRRPPCQNGQR
jgi:hypothetical protein